MPQVTRSIALLFTALLLTGCTEEPQATGPEGHEVTVVDAAAITDLRKQAADDGKVLVIDCWATWCSSCVAMFPHLHEAMNERGDDVMLASLSFDEGGDDVMDKVIAFLEEQHALDNAYIAAEGNNAKDAIAKALSDNWDGGVLPAVFVYKPDGSTAFELTETRGEVQDWVDQIASAVDQSLQDADD